MARVTVAAGLAHTFACVYVHRRQLVDAHVVPCLAVANNAALNVGCTCLFKTPIHFLRIDAPKWDCWGTREFNFSFFEDRAYCSAQSPTGHMGSLSPHPRQHPSSLTSQEKPPGWGRRHLRGFDSVSLATGCGEHVSVHLSAFRESAGSASSGPLHVF